MPFQIKSLFHRTLLTLIPFLLAVTVLYSVLVSIAITSTEDHIAKQYLEREKSALTSQSNIASSQQHKLPGTSYLSSYLTGDPDLPENYRNLGHGYHELEDSGRHLLVTTLPQSEQIVYLELKESAFSSLDKNEGIIHSALLVVAGLVIITGLIPAIITARLISQPISDLAKETQEDWHPGKELSNSQRLDEVGTLSHALQTLLQRQADSLEREKHFTRHASHEMRTPIAVIRNALAVVKLPNCDSHKMDRNIHRIGEACADLDLIVSTFLMLGRQHTPNDAQKSQVPLLKIVDAALKRSQQPVKAKGMTTSLSGDTGTHIYSNEALLQVAINNLIRNAANHGSKEISICLSKNRIDISNPIDTNIPARTGYGFGIEIVQRICQVEGWVLKSHSAQSRFQSSIEFNSDNVT